MQSSKGAKRKKLTKMEFVQIKPKHFINATNYGEAIRCPFALALNGHFDLTNCSCSLGIAVINGNGYQANLRWHSKTPLFNGTIYQGLSVNEAIELAKNAPNPELLPTIEVWVNYTK